MPIGKRFKIKLLGDEEGGSEVKSIIVPFSVERPFGSKARVSMKGTINNVPFQSSVFSQ